MDHEDAMRDALEDIEEAEAEVRLAEELGADTKGPLLRLLRALSRFDDLEEIERARKLN